MNNRAGTGYASVKDLLDSDKPAMAPDELSRSTPRLKSAAEKESIVRQNRITVIDVYADWCGPCKQIAPQFAALGQKYNKKGICACVVENHDDKLPPVPGTPPYQGVPTFCVYVDGAHFDSITGGDMEQIEKTILLAVEKAQELDRIRAQHADNPQTGDPQMGGPQMGGQQMGGPQMGGPQMGGPQMGGPHSMGGQQMGGPHSMGGQ